MTRSMTLPDPEIPTIRDIAELVALYDIYGPRRYGEGVSQLDHSLQCAALAVSQGLNDALVAAALLHDVGHLLWMQATGETSPPEFDTVHEDRGANSLSTLFGPEVSEPIRLHVQAKRVLCAIDPQYEEALSSGSVHSINQQGGVASVEEHRAFEALDFSEDAIALRRIDDAGKVESLQVEGFTHYLPLLHSLARS